MSSSEEDENTFVNEFENNNEDDISSENEDDLSGPQSTFSVLKPYHVPRAAVYTPKTEDGMKNNEGDNNDNDQTNRRQSSRGIKPPVPPKPKSFRKKDESDKIQQAAMPQGNEASCPPTEVQSDEQENLQTASVEAETGPGEVETHETNIREDSTPGITGRLETIEQDNTDLSIVTLQDFNESRTNICPESFVFVGEEHELEASVPPPNVSNVCMTDTTSVSESNQEHELNTTEYTEPQDNNPDEADDSDETDETDEYFDSVDYSDNKPSHEDKNNVSLESQKVTTGEETNKQLENNTSTAGDSNTESNHSSDSSFIVLGKGSVREPYDSMSSFVASEDVENIYMPQYSSCTYSDNDQNRKENEEKDNTILKENFEGEKVTPMQKDDSESEPPTVPTTDCINQDETVDYANKTDTTHEYEKCVDQEVIDDDISQPDDGEKKSLNKLAMFENLSKPVIERNKYQDEKYGEKSVNRNAVHIANSSQNEEGISQSTMSSSGLEEGKADPSNHTHMSVKSMALNLETSFAGFVTSEKEKEEKPAKIDDIPEKIDETVTQQKDSVIDEFEQSDETIIPDTKYLDRQRAEQRDDEYIASPPETSEDSTSLAQSQSEPVLDILTKAADNNAPTPPPRPPKRYSLAPKKHEHLQSLSSMDPNVYQQQAQEYATMPQYYNPYQYQTYQGYQQQYQYPSVHPYQYESGQFQYMYSPMAYYPGYQNFQDNPAGYTPANQPRYETPHNPEGITPERRTETTTEKTKDIKDSHTNVQSPSDNKHPDTPKVRPRTPIDERPAKKETSRKSFNPPPIHKASSSPSRLGQRIPKDRHPRGSPGRRSMEKSPNRNPSRKKTSDVGLKSDTLPVEDASQPAEPREFYLFVSNLSPSCADGMDNLNNYVEAGSSTIVIEDKVVYDQDKACAVLVLESKPDMDKLKEKTQSKPLDEHTISVCEIAPPNAIVVSCEDDISIDSLIYYFEVPKSGGGELDGDPQASEDNTVYIICFKQHQVVQSVCAKESHVLDGKTLRVSPCYTCELGTIWDTKVHALPIPEPVTIPVPKSHAQYLKRHCLVQLEDQVKKDYCTVGMQNQSIILTCGLKPGVDNFCQKLKTWSNTVDQSVKDFITEHVKDHQIIVDGSVWEDLAEFINSDQLDTNDLVIDLDKHNRLVTLTGSHDKITVYEEILENKMNAIDRQNRRCSVTKHFDTGVLSLPCIQEKIKNELQTNFSDNDVEFDKDGVKVSAVPEDADEMYVKIYEIIREVEKEKYGHKLSDNCVDFVNKKEAIKSKIDNQIKEAKIEATWQLDHSRLTVEVVKGKPETVHKIIMEQIKETEINLPKGGYQFMKTGDSYEFLNDLIEEYDDKADIVEDDAKAVIRVCGLMETVDEICDKVKRYVNENAIQNHHVPCQSHHINFLTKHGEKAIEQIERDLAEHKVKVEIKGTSIKVFAPLKGMDKAKQEVQTMLGAIVHEDYTIKKVNVCEVMKGSQVIQELEKETRCVIKLQKEFEQLVNVSGSDSAEPEDVQLSGDSYLGEKIVTDQRKIKIKIVEGEIAKQVADVVVVAVSPDLNLKSGAASKNLMEVGGEELQMECKLRYPKGIQHEEIAVIGGGDMKCTKVYLTCLKSWSQGGGSETAIHKIVTNCLHKVSKYFKTSICFAAMGTGQLKYPAGSVARAMFQSVNDFAQNNPHSSVTEVKFALHPKDKDTIKAFKDEESNSKEWLHDGYTGRQPSYGFRRSKAPTEVTAGPIKITVLVASLEKQQVDCVLVGANETLNLDKSGAAKSLANAAGGTTLQDECKNKLGNRLGEGEVAEIGAGKLPYKSVFLTVLPPASEDSEEQLTSVLQSFLQKAEDKNYQSVAIPALGTGYLKYSKYDVCRCFFNTISTWGQQHPRTTITDVRFVMFHKDHDTIEIFQKFAARKINASKRDRNFSSPGEYHGNKPRKEPSYRITSSDGPTAAISNAGCHIRQVSLKVQIGDILKSDADSVVSSCSPEFALNGAVASILKSKSPNLEADCHKRRGKFIQHGIAAIGVKNFPFKNITFVEFQDSLSGWRKIMVKCLEKANKKKWKSVAFPVLGSGQGIITFKPECIAECLFDAIDEFSKKHPKCVTSEVRMIVFHKQPVMMKPILAALHQQANKAPSSIFGKMYGFIAETCQDVFGPTRGTLTAEERKEREDKLSSMSMTIYSDDTSNIKQCQRKLDEKLEKSYTQKTIDNRQDIIKSLSPEQRDALINVPNLVDLRLDDNTGVISVYGCTKDVIDVTHILQSKLGDIATKKHEEEAADMMFDQVQWCFEEITDTEVKLVPYDKRSNLKIEKAYRDKQKTYELRSNDGTVYVIVFDDLIEYVKGDKDDQLRVVRKDILKSMGAALPEDWVEMGDKETIKVVTILQTDPHFKNVSTKFITEVKGGAYKDRIQFKLDTLTISKISRIQNQTLYQQYVANKKKIENEKTSLPAHMPVEMQLWHGTTQDATSSIITHGFNRSYCGKHGVWFGEGVYFAKDASYSARGWLSGADKGTSGQTVTGYIFLVNVLTGQYCQGVKGMRYLGPIPGNQKVLYDCAVDDLNKPMEFVIFSDTQSYPEYLIEFTAVQK